MRQVWRVASVGVGVGVNKYATSMRQVCDKYATSMESGERGSGSGSGGWVCESLEVAWRGWRSSGWGMTRRAPRAAPAPPPQRAPCPPPARWTTGCSASCPPAQPRLGSWGRRSGGAAGWRGELPVRSAAPHPTTARGTHRSRTQRARAAASALRGKGRRSVSALLGTCAVPGVTTCIPGPWVQRGG